MKRPSSSKRSRTNFRRLRSMKDKEILITPEHPEASVKHIVGGVVRSGLRIVPPKASVSLRIDADVLEWFKAQGSGYQTRINAILRAYRDAAARQLSLELIVKRNRLRRECERVILHSRRRLGRIGRPLNVVVRSR